MSSFQTTLSGGKAEGLKQPRYSSLQRSVKVLQNIDKTRAKYGLDANANGTSRGSSSSSKSTPQERQHGVASTPSGSIKPMAGDAKGKHEADKASSWAARFKCVAQPARTGDLAPKAEEQKQEKRAATGYGLEAFAPSPKRRKAAAEPRAPSSSSSSAAARSREPASPGRKRPAGSSSSSLPPTKAQVIAAANEREKAAKAAKTKAESQSASPSQDSKGKRRRTSDSESVPAVPLFSAASALEVRALTSKAGLARASNPITHSDMYTRTQHYVSASTGHQQSNRGGGTVESGGTSWMKLRASKLQEQAAAEAASAAAGGQKGSELFRNVVVYINGYTGSGVTNRELIRLVHAHGGSVYYNMCAAVTHTVSTMALSGKKTDDHLRRRSASGGSRLVTPQWVLDSIERGRRMPERDYAVFHESTQGDLRKVFFSAGGGAAGGSKNQTQPEA